MAVPRAHLPHRPRPRHSRGHRRAAGSAGSGSARCQPRKSNWCKHPRPTAPQRPLPGPGVYTTGQGLREQESGRVSCLSLTLGLAHPSPIILARTLASFTAVASLSHLCPAVGAGEGLALLLVTLHVAPLKTNVFALGTSCRAWGPGPHTSGGLLGHGQRQQPLLSRTLTHKETRFMFKRGMKSSPQLLAAAQGPMPVLTQRGHLFLITANTRYSLVQCPEAPPFIHLQGSPPPTLPPPAHMAGASNAAVVGVPPACSVCHSPALRLHHTFQAHGAAAPRGGMVL